MLPKPLPKSALLRAVPVKVMVGPAAIPAVTDPEVCLVRGITEVEAKEKGLDVQVVKNSLGPLVMVVLY